MVAPGLQGLGNGGCAERYGNEGDDSEVWVSCGTHRKRGKGHDKISPDDLTVDGGGNDLKLGI